MTECCTQRILVGVTAFFVLTTAALVAVLVWREVTRDSAGTKYRPTSAVVNKTYPGFFRTPGQQLFYQQKYIASFENRMPVTNRVAANESCTFQCFPVEGQKRRRRSSSGYIYHGCCQSRVTFISPSHSDNYSGVNRTLIQFDGARQYFAVHECSAYTWCSGCVCLQENSLYTAVVWKHGETDPDDIDDTETDFFFFDGCCKCVNT